MKMESGFDLERGRVWGTEPRAIGAGFRSRSGTSASSYDPGGLWDVELASRSRNSSERLTVDGTLGEGICATR